MMAAITIRTVIGIPRCLKLSEPQETVSMSTKAQAYGGTVIRFAEAAEV